MSRFYTYSANTIKNWSPDSPEPLPDLSTIKMWPEAPWNIPVDRFEVDKALSEELLHLHTYSPGPQIVRLNHGRRSVQWAGGVPYQWAGKTDVSIGRYNIAVFGIKRDIVRLPNKVKRTGDPNAAGMDCQAFIIDSERGKYIEISALDTANFLTKALVRTSLQCSQAHVFDLNGHWHATRGTTAAKIPLVPMLPRPEEFKKGHINHAMQICLGGYSSGKPIGYARDTDGKIKNHPLVAGQMLRLKREVQERIASSGTRDALVLANGLHEYGVVVADFTNPSVGHSLRLPATRTINLGDMSLDISDFEAMVTPNYPF